MCHKTFFIASSLIWSQGELHFLLLLPFLMMFFALVSRFSYLSHKQLMHLSDVLTSKQVMLMESCLQVRAKKRVFISPNLVGIIFHRRLWYFLSSWQWQISKSCRKPKRFYAMKPKEKTTTFGKEAELRFHFMTGKPWMTLSKLYVMSSLLNTV